MDGIPEIEVAEVKEGMAKKALGAMGASGSSAEEGGSAMGGAISGFAAVANTALFAVGVAAAPVGLIKAAVGAGVLGVWGVLGV